MDLLTRGNAFRRVIEPRTAHLLISLPTSPSAAERWSIMERISKAKHLRNAVSIHVLFRPSYPTAPRRSVYGGTQNCAANYNTKLLGHRPEIDADKQVNKEALFCSRDQAFPGSCDI